ncbi:MAG: hypothetical protein E7252_09560 [Lachnospira sp.]|nr:hypothetical protein [Lachnospira sp.]
MKKYCIRKCIPISHSNDDVREHAHTHTVEVSIYTRLKDTPNEISEIQRLEKLIEDCLAPYYECYLNDKPGFENDTSIERLGDMIFYDIDEAFKNIAIDMEKLEIGETPLRTYILTKVV